MAASERRLGVVADLPRGVEVPLEDLVGQVALGDESAFEALYRRVGGPVLGLVRRVLRDPAQSEEVAQEVLLEVWRTSTRFDADRGSATSWIMTMAHRRAVDRRDLGREYDEVAETVEVRLEQQAVRSCLGGLTDLQRESVQLAYYGGYTYKEVGELLDVPLGTVKTRLRDGLIRLRDCLGVTA